MRQFRTKIICLYSWWPLKEPFVDVVDLAAVQFRSSASAKALPQWC